MLTGSDQLSHFDAGWYVIVHALAANSVMEIKGLFFLKEEIKGSTQRWLVLWYISHLWSLNGEAYSSRFWTPSPPPSLCSRGSHRSPPADVPPPSFCRPGSGTAAIRNPSCIYIGTNVLCYHHYVANAFLQFYAWVRLHWNEWLARAQGQRTASTSCLNPLFTWKAYHFLPDSFQKPFCLIGFSPAERWINMYLHARYRIISRPLHFCPAISSL